MLYRCCIRLYIQTSSVAFNPLWIASCEYIEFMIHNGSNATLAVCMHRRNEAMIKYRILTILYDFIHFTQTAKIKKLYIYIYMCVCVCVCVILFYNVLHSQHIYVYQPPCTLNLAAECYIQRVLRM